MEVVIALLVLGAVVGPLILLVIQNKSGIKASAREVTAANEASELLAILTTLPYEQIPVSRGAEPVPEDRWNETAFKYAPELNRWWPEDREYFTFDDLPPPDSRGGDTIRKYLRITERALCDEPGSASRVKIVELEMTWKRPGRKGSTRKVRFVSMVGCRASDSH